jgi:tRNA pseudouridine55 synthase
MSHLHQFPEGPFILNVLKPSELTSSRVVNHFKWVLPKGNKIGHFGTLDPFASGVLMLGISGASKLNDFVHEFLPKSYLALGKLGLKTDSGDITGQIISEEGPVETGYSKRELQDSFREKFLGDYWQVPPAFSAVKYQGKALYKWAREGIFIKKDPVLRHLYSLDVLSVRGPFVLFRVKVSSGTYIRTLFEDMAELMGQTGTLVSLIRESVGDISIKNSLRPKHWPLKGKKLEQIGEAVKNSSLLKMDKVVPFKKAFLSSSIALDYSNGKKISLENVLKWEDSSLSLPSSNVWILNEKGRLLGLSKIDQNYFLPHFNLPPKNNFCS